MNRKIKIKVKGNYEDKIFELEEDAKVGDYIDLKDIKAIDFDELSNAYLTKINDEVNKKLKLQVDNAKKVALDENEIIFLKKKEELIKAHSTELEKLKKENTELKTEKDILEKDIESKVKVKLGEVKNNLEEENITKIKKISDDLQKKAQTKEATLNYKINELQEEIDKIKRNKNTPSKAMGEELEKWILDEYNKYYSADDSASFEKANKAIEGTKPDFIYKSFDKNRNVLSSIAIEAKTQADDTTDGKKNLDFVKKLDGDRKKNECEYALLVTELEPQNDFVFLKVPNYENMFIIRPQYFLGFINLIKSIGNKKASIDMQNISLKSKQELMKEFEDAKNSILDITIKNMVKHLEIINKNADNIKNAADEILKSKRLILEQYVEHVKTKISGLTLLKVKSLNKVEQFNSNNLDQLIELNQEKLENHFVHEKIDKETFVKK